MHSKNLLSWLIRKYYYCNIYYDLIGIISSGWVSKKVKKNVDMFQFDKFLGFVKYKIYVTQLNELQT